MTNVVLVDVSWRVCWDKRNCRSVYTACTIHTDLRRPFKCLVFSYRRREGVSTGGPAPSVWSCCSCSWCCYTHFTLHLRAECVCVCVSETERHARDQPEPLMNNSAQLLPVSQRSTAGRPMPGTCIQRGWWGWRRGWFQFWQPSVCSRSQPQVTFGQFCEVEIDLLLKFSTLNGTAGFSNLKATECGDCII